MDSHEVDKYREILEIEPDSSEEEITDAYNYLKELYSSNSVALLSIDDDLDEQEKDTILAQLEDAYQGLIAHLREVEEEEKLKKEKVIKKQKMPEQSDSGFNLDERLADMFEMADTLVEENIGSAIVTGDALRQRREEQGLSIHELAKATKIPYKTLVYIEKEKFDKIQDAGYLRWYVSTFAKTLAMEPKQTANHYMKRFREWEKKNK